MRTVEIADDIYAALQRMAVPFEDDINDVLRRLLRTARAAQQDGTRAFDRAGNAVGGVVAVTQSTSVSGTVVPPEPLDDARSVKVHRRGSNGSHLPQSTIRAGVLGVLRSSAAPLGTPDLLEALETQFRDRMGDGDVEIDEYGVARWQSQARNVLKQLQYEGTVEHLEDGTYRCRRNIS